MSTKLQNYFNDGANCNVQAVLCLLKHKIGSGIEESWDDEKNYYKADIKIARWENCREQGYIVYLRNEKHNQLNIAFFEHRNSDELCAVKWIQSSVNSLTIETADFNKKVYKDKYDISVSFSYNQAYELAEWIFNELTKHWIGDEKK